MATVMVSLLVLAAPALAVETVQTCQCMEYWTCVLGGGMPTTYCGLTESSVCCFPRPPRLGSHSHSSCGRKGADSGIKGVAGAGEWPWHAAILEKDNAVYVCGASLIDESWVLTAAHCVEKFHLGKGQCGVRLWRLSHRRVLGADSSPLCGEVVSGLFILPDKDRTNLQAAILEKDNAVYVCGASLIDESWVLTAAHCGRL
ncbi:hypothetical protein J6590_087702 [Homalodisca vitripennis]|nr:hypothetical protein J6590_087702 [Homalodisca vitripennis]